MKFSELYFKNFRGFEELSLPLSTTKPLIITGPNGSGKSSVLYGLETLLTGNNPVTNKTSLNGLAKRGESRCEITGVTEELGEVTRRLLPTHTLNIEGAGKLTLAAGQHKIGDPKLISWCLRGSSFLAMDLKDQAARWWEWLGITMEQEDIVRELKAEALPLVQTLSDLKIRIGKDVSRLYKACYDERTAKKRERDNAKSDLENLQAQNEEAEPEQERPSPDRLEHTRRRYQKVNQDLGAARAHWAKVDSLRATVKPGPSPETLAAAEQRLTDLKAELGKGEGIQKRLAELNRIVQKSCCHACNRPFNPEAIAEANREQASLEPLLPDMADLAQKVNRGEAYFREISQNAATVAKLAELEAEPIPPVNRLEADLADVEADLADVEKAEVLWAEYERELESQKTLVDRLATLEKQCECLEKLVEVTKDGPGGIKAKILRRHTDEVDEQLTGTLSQWGMAARLTDALTIEIERDGEWRALEVLSDGEGLLVALALQVWLCEKSGLRILVMDRAEALDSENQALLYAACEQLLEVGAIDHAIICGVGLDHPDAVTLTENLEKAA